MTRTGTRASHIFFILISCLLLASGCASKYGTQLTDVNYYPKCYAPLKDLREAEDSFYGTVALGAVIGVLGGAILGLLATGDAEGAVVGAVAGGLVGTGLGYYEAKQNEIVDDNKRMASYLKDIDGDISGIDRATAAAKVARTCYDREFNTALDHYKNGKMSKEELTARYVEIRQGCTEAAEILGTMVATLDDKEQDYRLAIESEAKKSKKPVPVVTANKSGKTSAPDPNDTSLNAVAQNTQRLKESKQQAQSEADALRQLDAEMDSTLATILS